MLGPALMMEQPSGHDQACGGLVLDAEGHHYR